LAIDDDRVVGSLAGCALDQYWSYGESLLYEIDVWASERRRGIGARLVNAFAGEARAADAGNVWVVTRRSNTAAVCLYE